MSRIEVYMSKKILHGTQTSKFKLSCMKECERCVWFVNNVYFNFRKILWNFYGKIFYPKNDCIPTYIVSGEVLYIIINIL
jgi:hypothetical protein